MFNNFFNQTFCRLSENVEKYSTGGQATDENITWRMRFECRITKTNNTHSEHIILIAFSWQQWLRERTPVLHYTYISSLC
jgi:hypothetical protein